MTYWSGAQEAQVQALPSSTRDCPRAHGRHATSIVRARNGEGFDSERDTETLMTPSMEHAVAWETSTVRAMPVTVSNWANTGAARVVE
jgi:hypothetical protein